MNELFPFLLAVESIAAMVVDIAYKNYGRALYWLGAAIINASLLRFH